MSDTARTDQRREAGKRTRQRLLDAARGLLADHDEDAVSLRDLTEAADANIAAVSYHFGGKEALCRATIERAIDHLVQAQVDGMRQLGEESTLEEIAAVLARPVICALAGPACADQSYMRIVARVATDPSPQLREWKRAALARAESELIAPLRRALPSTPDDQLRFRLECAAGILHFMTTGNMRVDLTTMSEEGLERLVVPVIAGALAGSAYPSG